MARSRYNFAEPDRPHFLTCTVVAWLPVFTRKAGNSPQGKITSEHCTGLLWRGAPRDA